MLAVLSTMKLCERQRKSDSYLGFLVDSSGELFVCDNFVMQLFQGTILSFDSELTLGFLVVEEYLKTIKTIA